MQAQQTREQAPQVIGQQHQPGGQFRHHRPLTAVAPQPPLVFQLVKDILRVRPLGVKQCHLGQRRFPRGQIGDIYRHFVLRRLPEQILRRGIDRFERAHDDDPPCPAPALQPYARLGELLAAYRRRPGPLGPGHPGDGPPYIVGQLEFEQILRAFFAGGLMPRHDRLLAKTHIPTIQP